MDITLWCGCKVVPWHSHQLGWPCHLPLHFADFSWWTWHPVWVGKKEPHDRNILRCEGVHCKCGTTYCCSCVKEKQADRFLRTEEWLVPKRLVKRGAVRVLFLGSVFWQLHFCWGQHDGTLALEVGMTYSYVRMYDSVYQICCEARACMIRKFLTSLVEVLHVCGRLMSKYHFQELWPLSRHNFNALKYIV